MVACTADTPNKTVTQMRDEESCYDTWSAQASQLHHLLQTSPDLIDAHGKRNCINRSGNICAGAFAHFARFRPGANKQSRRVAAVLTRLTLTLSACVLTTGIVNRLHHHQRVAQSDHPLGVAARKSHARDVPSLSSSTIVAPQFVKYSR